MQPQEITKLIQTRKPALVKHALQVWEARMSHLPQPLIEALDIDDIVVLEPALKLASKYHPSACAPAVAKLCHSKDAVVRRLAVQAITEEMAEHCRAPLKKILKEEKDPFVLASSMNAAAIIRLEVEKIQPYLKHKEVRVRANAVRAAAVCDPSRIHELLEPKLRDPAFRVQNEALKALAQFVPEDELENLIRKRLVSEKPAVRAATAFIAGELPLSVKTVLLIQALEDTDNRVVANAVRSLCKLDDPVAISAVIKAYLSHKDSNCAYLILAHIDPASARVLVDRADRFGPPQNADRDLMLRVLWAASSFTDWKPFMPWIMAAVDREESELRLLALKIVADNMDFFRSNVERLLEKSLASNESPCLALAAYIKWKAGKTEGFEMLREMLFSGRLEDIRAVTQLLKNENGLMARQLLKEAGLRGIHTEPRAAQPIKLPNT